MFTTAFMMPSKNNYWRTHVPIHGDQKQEQTFIGPMITEKEAQRVEQWVAEAVQAGERCCAAARVPAR